METMLACVSAVAETHFIASPVCDAGGHSEGAGSVSACEAEVGCVFVNGECSAAYVEADGVVQPIVCTSAVSTAGYGPIVEVNLDLGAGPLNVSGECVAGYEGVVSASACGSHGEAYGLSGCEAIVCSAPSSIAGYDVMETQLSVAAGFNVSATCAGGYESSGSGPAAASCGAAS